ncbi:MAG: DEAD/DEAH box helicase [Gemmatimonadaceae bacterium]
MDRTVIVESGPAVRAVIARVILGEQSSEPALGSIHLKPHQVSSIARLESALNEFGGALLCDDVGMGKTFVALAIARRFPRRLIVVPAALRDMWRDALARAGITAEVITFERLSRSEPRHVQPDLLIMDESHHARNPRTLRYRRITELARNARVLMLTATPIHNRGDDLVALLSVFLGSRANNLTEPELSRCVVRRERGHTAEIIGVPRVLPVVAFEVPDDPDVVARLMSLPPPLPASGGGSGGALINRGLIHQWSSSEAALRDALRRRIARATALIASLRAGRYPTAAELEAWTFSDGALQLGFPQLLSAPTPDASTLLQSVLTHANALETLLNTCAAASTIDQARACYLSDIRKANAGAKIVAFAQYSSTISEMYRCIAHSGQVAMLSATGARVAGGKLSRQDAIARFAPRANRTRPPSRAEAIDFLLATDLLSEGVNLQDAEVVIHVDVPWTAARMEQRVGRAARMGSRHHSVSVYQFRPPASAESILHEEALVATKWNVARRLVGANAVAPLASHTHIDRAPSSLPARAERLRGILAQWAIGESTCFARDERIHVAAVKASEGGFIAAGYLGDTPLLLTCRGETLSIDLDAQIAVCPLGEGEPVQVDRAEYDRACRAIQEWADCSEASVSAGAAVAPPAGRKRLLNRIDAALYDVPPHVRASRAAVAATARMVASDSHGAAIEQELETLTHSPMPDDDWLNTLASLSVRPKNPQKADGLGFHLRALLLLRS